MSDTTVTTSRWTDLANPTRFIAFSGRVLPWLSAIAVIVLAIGLYLAVTAPEDVQQGITVRIMFLHVPFAWLSMMIYAIMAVSSLGTLVWRHPLADVALKAAAPIGAVFTFLALVTGSIWGRPMWGTWWVWDARLTSMFVLFLVYLGIIALTRALDDPGRAARAAALVTLVGVVNLPIIKFSVDWWNTLHQPDSISLTGSSMDPAYLYPLFICMGGFTLAFFALHLFAMRTEIWRRRVAAMRRMAARSADRRQEAS